METVITQSIIKDKSTNVWSFGQPNISLDLIPMWSKGLFETINIAATTMTDTSKYRSHSYAVMESENIAKVYQFTFGGISSLEFTVGLLMFVVPWCSGYHYCITWFNKAWTQVLHWFKSCLQHVEDSQCWGWSQLKIRQKTFCWSTISQK